MHDATSYLQTINTEQFDDKTDLVKLEEACSWVFSHLEQAQQNANEFRWATLIQAVHFLQSQSPAMLQKMGGHLSFIYKDSLRKGAKYEDFLDLKTETIHFTNTQGWTPWHFIIHCWPAAGVSYEDIAEVLYRMQQQEAIPSPTEVTKLLNIVLGECLTDDSPVKDLYDLIAILLKSCTPDKFLRSPLHVICKTWLSSDNNKISISVIQKVLEIFSAKTSIDHKLLLGFTDSGQRTLLHLVAEIGLKKEAPDQILAVLTSLLSLGASADTSHHKLLSYFFKFWINDSKVATQRNDVFKQFWDLAPKVFVTQLPLVIQLGSTVLTSTVFLPFIQSMIADGRDFTVADTRGITPLHASAQYSTAKVFSCLLTQFDDNRLRRIAEQENPPSLFSCIVANTKHGLAIMEVFISKLVKIDIVFFCNNEKFAPVWNNIKPIIDQHDHMEAINRVILAEGSIEQVFYWGSVNQYLWRKPVFASNAYAKVLSKLLTAESYPPSPNQLKMLELVFYFSNEVGTFRQFLCREGQAALGFLWGINGARQDIRQGVQKLEGLFNRAQTKEDTLVSCIVLARHYAADTPRAIQFYKTACEWVPNSDALTTACCDFALREIDKLATARHTSALLVRAEVRRKQDKVEDAARDYCQFLLDVQEDVQGQKVAVQGLVLLSANREKFPVLIVFTLIHLFDRDRLSDDLLQALLQAFDLERFFSKDPFGGSNPEYSLKLAVLYTRIARSTKEKFEQLESLINAKDLDGEDTEVVNLFCRLAEVLEGKTQGPGILPRYLFTKFVMERIEVLNTALSNTKSALAP